MKAKITSEFKALRNPGDKKNSTIRVGEVVDGPLASAAIANGFGKKVSDDAEVTAAQKTAPEPTPKGKKGKGGGGSGEGEGE